MAIVLPLGTAVPAFADVVEPLETPNLAILSAGTVLAVARQPNGGIVVGGSFESINGVARQHLARFAPDGTLDPDWAPVVDAPVEAISIAANGDVYVGGVFQHAGQGAARSYLAKFSGSGAGALDGAWAPNANNVVYALTIGADGAIYAGGAFTFVGSFVRNHIAKIDPASGAVNATWNASANDTVSALAPELPNSIYAAGAFTSIGGQSRSHIARLSGSGTGTADGWNPSADRPVAAIVRAPSGAIYAGGYFLSISGQPRAYAVKLSASTGLADPSWNPQPNSDVVAIAVDAGESVYIGGDFDHVGLASHAHIAKLAGTGTGDADASWNASTDSVVYALAFAADGRLYAGGVFNTVDAEQRFALAALATNGSLAGAATDMETPGFVYAMAEQADGSLIVGGVFGKVGQVQRRNLLRIDADGVLDPDWKADTDSEVDTLLSGADGSVYAGGLFTTIGGVPRNYIAKVASDGVVDANWNPTASFKVDALAWATDGDLYVGGYFISIGGQPLKFLAKLAPDGNGAADPAWAPAPDNVVTALAVDGTGALYAGGFFTHVGGLGRNYIAKVDGAGTGVIDPNWNPSADVFVLALATANDTVYVGGAFTSIGGQPRASIARLDGSGSGAAVAGWNPSADNWVQSLHVGDDEDVFAGGWFQVVGGQARPGLVRLSAETGAVDPDWAPYSIGPVLSMTTNARGILHIGGSFETVSGIPRFGLAALPSAPVRDTTFESVSTEPGTSRLGESYVVSFTVTASDGATPTGSVSVVDDLGTTCGPVVLVDGAGACTLASPAVGVRTLTATYTPDNATFGGSIGIGFHVIDPGVAVVTIVADAPDPSEVMQSYTVTVHVEPAVAGLPTPTGSVTIGDGSDICFATLDENANASCMLFGWTIGSFGLVASYSGDATYESADSAPEPHTVGRAATTIVISPGSSSVTTEPVTFFANLGSFVDVTGGTVTFGDGESSCTAEVVFFTASCTVAFAHAGVREVTAAYSGDDEHEPAVSDPTQQFVSPAATEVSIHSHLPEPSLPGQPVTVTVDVVALPPAIGPVTGSISVETSLGSTCVIDAPGGSCDLTFGARGMQGIDALFFANDDFQSSFVAVNHRVNEPPFALNDVCATDEDHTLVLGAANGVLANDSDEDGDSLFVADPGTRTAGGIGGTVVLATDGGYTYTPPPNANGEATFEYTVSDGLETATAEVTISVAPVNDPPTFVLAASPHFDPGSSGVRTTPAFATMTSAGPPDETDAPLAWHVRTVSDPSGVLSAPSTIGLDGTLTTSLSGHGGVATLGVALQDDGGTANGGNDTSPEQTFTITVGAGADLSIAVDDGTTFAIGGDPLLYMITVRNAGPDDASGAHVFEALSSNLVDAMWTCTPSAGASCSLAGTGGIDDHVALPSGAMLVYELTATVLADPEQPVENFVSVAAPAGVIDFNPANDGASDVDATGVFADGFDVTGDEDEAKATRKQ